MKKFKLSVLEKDTLAEVASISSGHASTALSNFTGKEVELTTPSVDVIHIKELPRVVGGPKKMVVGSYTPIANDLVGNMMAVFSKKDALLLVDIISKKKLGTTKQFKKEEQIILNQLMDSLSTTYLNTMAEFLEVGIRHANPRFISTFGESVIDFVTLGIEKKLEYVILLKTDFTVKPKIRGDFILLLAIESIQHFMELIKKKVGEV